jgi:hypothetical protein
MDTAKLVVFSHLSDAQAILNTQTEVGATEHINFAKYIILRTGGDLNKLIDPNQMYADFLQRK